MDTIIQEVDGMTQNFLLSNGFDINAYQDLLESETANDSVPHLLHLLGELIVSSLVKQPRIQKIAGKIYFDRAQKYLFVAHQFDERLGCYGLARLYATPAFCDETVRNLYKSVLVSLIILLLSEMSPVAGNCGKLRHS